MKRYLSIIRNIVLYTGLKIMLEFIAIFIFLSVILFMKPYASDDHILRIWHKNKYCIIVFIDLLILFVLALILSNREENLWSRVKFKKLDIRNVCKLFVVSIGLVITSLSIVKLTGHEHILFRSLEILKRPIKCPIGILSIVMFIPIFEEIFFRGLIFRELRNNINVIISLIIQAIIFSLFYGKFTQTIYSFIMGIILGILYYWTQSIWGSIIPHVIHNWCYIFIFKTDYIQLESLNLIWLFIGVVITVVGLILIYNDFKTNNSIKFNIVI